MADKTPLNFTVLIVGSGIAGLTLARALANAGIHSIVLDKRSRAAATGGGASIGIFPNGAKCLDELGLFDEILRSSDPIQESYLWSNDTLLSRRNYPQTVFRRLGYPILFIRRQTLLESLSHELPEDLVQTVYDKEIISVEEMLENVSITCSDGSVLFGSLVVGADGYRSVVQGKISKCDQSDNLPALNSFNPPTEFSCIYGVSKFAEKITKNTLHQSYNWGYSVTAVNSRDVTYWCVYLRDNKKIRTSKQNSRESLRSILQPILFKNFACGTNLSELLDDATVCYHSPLEERLGAKWFHGRMVCIGDSVHKMVPNLGQGGNMSIQDATTLASCLADLKSISPRPTTAEIHQCLDTWQKIRFDTVQRAWNASHWLIRLETFSSTKDFILGRFIVPLLDNYIANQLCTILQGEDTHQEQPPDNYQSSLLGFLKHYLLYFWGFEMLRSLY